MRRRLALLWTLAVLGAALALPATTAGASSGYGYKVKYNYCDGATVRFKVKNIAEGWTNANKLTVDSLAQRKSDGVWRTIYEWDRAKYQFEPDGTRHWLTSWRSWQGTTNDSYRIVFKLRAWRNSNVLASVTLNSVKC